MSIIGRTSVSGGRVALAAGRGESEGLLEWPFERVVLEIGTPRVGARVVVVVVVVEY